MSNLEEKVAPEMGATAEHIQEGEPQDNGLSERRLRTKIDLMILPTVCLLYLFCFIDRANIGNARIAGLEEELNIEGYDYNIILTMFYIPYIIFEIPLNILCKFIGPGWFIPITTLLFGAASMATAWVRTMPQMMAVRFILGIFEAGMLPGIAYYLSRWYRRSELTFRISIYIVTAPLAGAFGGLLASAILTLDEALGVHSWRMIFAIEGIITLALGLIGLLTLTDRPSSARWLSEAEKDLAESRVRSERVGQTQVLDRMDKTKLKRGIFSPVTLVMAAVYFFNNVSTQGLAFFAPTIVRTIYAEKSVVQQQLYTVPPYIVGAFFTVLLPLLSWRTDRRQIFMIIGAFTPIAGYLMFVVTDSTQVLVRYGAIFLTASTIFSYGVFPNAQISANVMSDTARSSGIGFNVMIGNIGGLVATWSFLPFDSPDYIIGNGLNLATTTLLLILCVGLLFWMKRDNRARAANQARAEEELHGMSRQEKEDLDWKHPHFRWRT